MKLMLKPIPGTLRVLGAVVAVVSAMLCGCRSTSSSAPASPHSVQYRLDWSWDSIKRVAGSEVWEVVNNLGYRVRVTRGYVVSYSMQLVECPISSAQVSGDRGTWFSWSLASPAYAGHASGTPNPASIRPMQVESLTAPSALAAGAVVLTPQAYCQLHYLVARASNDARSLPSDVEMENSSLHIDGTYVAPGGSEEKPVTIHLAEAYGAMFDHTAGSSEPIRVDTGKSATRVTVRRHLGRIFDGVDFDQMRPPVIANQTLKALVDHSEIEIETIDEKP